MERLKAWWRARQEVRVSTDDGLLPQKVAQVLTILVALCIAFIVVWGIFLSGRWMYRTVFSTNDTGDQSSQTQPKEEKSAESDSSEPEEAKPDTPAPTQTAPPPQSPPDSAIAPPASEAPKLPRSGPEE